MGALIGRTIELVARVPEAVAASAAAFFVAAVTLYRLGAIKEARYPGHADPALYYNVAQRMNAGQGMTIDYAWEYLSGQHPLPQYAFGYWLPLPSAMMSLALHLRNSLASALAVNVLMTVLLAVATYFLARGLIHSPWVPAVASVLVSVQPFVSHFAVTSEAAIYFAAFAVASMALAVRAQSHVWLWPVAGVFAGLAGLSRSEGLVLIAVLVIAAAASLPKGRRVAFVGALVAGYVLVTLPLYVQNVRHFGSLLPPASANFPFITDYNDLYALHVDHSFSALLGGGPWQFVDLRLSTLAVQLDAGFRSMHSVDACVIL
ncbi:MAG: glycosyltransferase family 39 protein, partial [Pseudonocardiales bacterium]